MKLGWVGQEAERERERRERREDRSFCSHCPKPAPIIEQQLLHIGPASDPRSQPSKFLSVETSTSSRW